MFVLWLILKGGVSWSFQLRVNNPSSCWSFAHGDVVYNGVISLQYALLTMWTPFILEESNTSNYVLCIQHEVQLWRNPQSLKVAWCRRHGWNMLTGNSFLWLHSIYSARSQYEAQKIRNAYERDKHESLWGLISQKVRSVTVICLLLQ